MPAGKFVKLAVAAMLAAMPLQARAQAPSGEVAAYKRAVEQRFAAWLQSLWPEAEAQGISRKTFDAHTKGLKLDWSLPHLVLPDPAGPGGPPLPAALKPKPIHQPEFDIPANYFNKNTLNVLAATGRGKMNQFAPQLRAIASPAELEAMRAAPASLFTALLQSTYWQRRYSLPRVRIVPWETTHGSTLIGTGVVRPGLLLITLGACDTVADIHGELAFRNGSLAREWIRLEHGLDWDAFAALIEQQPGNGGCVMLPWLADDVEEIDVLWGDKPWAYGIEPNRKTLETLIQYMEEQGVIPSRPRVDDLFVSV